MTFGEHQERQTEQFGNMNKLSAAMKDALQLAQEQGRMTCGIYSTVTMLEACPEHVMYCVLPITGCGEVEKEIQWTLIEAFCWENEVRLIKVDSVERLAKLLGEKKPMNDNDMVAGRRSLTSQDLSCVVVQYPQTDLSETEKLILYYYKACCEDEPHPYIPLPA